VNEDTVARRALERAAAGKTLPLAAIFGALTNRESKPVKLARPGDALTWVGGPRVPGAQRAQGFWSDGVEESNVVPLPAAQADKLAVALAQRNRQKSALWFTPGNGPDTLHVVSFGGGYPRSLARIFQKHGVTEFTVTQNPVAVHVVDQGGRNAGAVKAAAAEAGGAYEARPGTAGFRAQLARKRDTDPRARAQELKAFLNAIHYGRYDQTDRGAFADWLREVTGNPDDPRAHVAQHHMRSTLMTPSPQFLQSSPHAFRRKTSAPYVYRTPRYARDTGLTFFPVGPRVEYDKLNEWKPTHAVVTWSVPIPGAQNPGSDRWFSTRMEPNELHDFIDKLPKEHQQAWRDHAVAHGLHDTRGKV